ncbi:MAG TPA: cell wall-binding repeat-containing protein [Nitriliruptorales bacterium]|nr:cell wall-binding repeat-containing protein [Nitriliruptorales bacterium]
MNENRRASLTSYAWLAALATLVALFVPLAHASAAPAGGIDLAQTEAQAAAAASTLDAVPESATNQTTESHTLQVTFSADNGSDAGATINFEVIETTRPSGVTQEPASCDTGADGTCTSGEYTAVDVGKDLIRAYHDANDNGQFDEGEANDLVTKTWTDGTGEVTRLEGITRIQTAIDISEDLFPDPGSAPAAVLARADVYADALAGAPFADEQDAPVLLTFPDHLYNETDNAQRNTKAELQRILGNDGNKTVYLLGGETALSQQVQADVLALGYKTVRIAGPTRIETAVQIADELGNPSNLLVTTAYNFPDALSAGAAAAADHVNGAVLLTTAGEKHPATQAYLTQHADAAVYSIGGPAVNPYAEGPGEDDPDTDESIYGPGRIETAVFAAEFFFTDPTDVGIARADDFPDSLTGGRHIADQGGGGPIILTKTDHLHVSIVGEPPFDAARRYLCANADSVQTAWIYGGQVAVADHTEGEVLAAIQGEPDAEDGCTFPGEWDAFPGRPDTHFGEQAATP